MKIPSIECDRCILCGICKEEAPSVFSINDDLGIVIIAELEKYPEAEVDEAIKNCPESCISW